MISRWIPALALGMVMLGAPAAAQQAPPARLNVLDYFFLLRPFEGDTRSNRWMIDERNGAVVDIPNGYLRAIGDGAQWPLWICVFRRSDGGHLIGVKSLVDGDEYTQLVFYRYVDREFINVSEAVLPEMVRPEWRYEMPRHGTTIHVSDEAGRAVYDLAWTGERFERRPPAQR